MSISSTQLITTNTHLYLPVEVWRERIATLLAFSEIVSLFFQTCHFLRTSRLEILRPMAEAEQELMQITPYRGLDLPLERIVSVWLRLPSASLRAIRSSFAANPPQIYAAEYADANVLLNERLIALHGENGLLTPPSVPPGTPNHDFFTTTTDLATDHVLNNEKSIRRACLIVRTFLDPDRAAKRFVKIAFGGHLLWGYSRSRNIPTPTESQTWERAQTVLNLVPDDMRDLVCFYLARASYSSGGTLAIEYAHLISDPNLRKKMLGEIAKRSTITTTKEGKSPSDDPFRIGRTESSNRKALKERSNLNRSEKSLEKIKPREQNFLDQRTENCAEKTLKKKPSGPDSDDDDSRLSKMTKGY